MKEKIPCCASCSYRLPCVDFPYGICIRCGYVYVCPDYCCDGYVDFESISSDCNESLDNLAR